MPSSPLRKTDASKHDSNRPVREYVATPDTSSIFRLEYCDVRFWYPWHFHPELEIKHIIKGSGSRVIGDSVEPFSDGDLCLVGSGTPHCWRSSPVRGHWVRAQVVQFSAALFDDGQARPRAFHAIAQLLSVAQRGVQLTGPSTHDAVAELERLLAAQSEARQLGHLLTLLAIFAESPDTRLLATATAGAPVVEPTHEMTEQVLSYLRENAAARLTEVQVATHFGQSPSAFSRFFKRSFGKPFNHYLAELRLAHASNLLLTHNVPVQEVARLAGFGTVASLNRHFRSIKRTTPSAYRDKARKLNVGLRAAEGQLLRCTETGARPHP